MWFVLLKFCFPRVLTMSVTTRLGHDSTRLLRRGPHVLRLSEFNVVLGPPLLLGRVLSESPSTPFYLSSRSVLKVLEPQDPLAFRKTVLSLS